MTRSGIRAAALVLAILSGASAFAQTGGGASGGSAAAPGTNAAGTANASSNAGGAATGGVLPARSAAHRGQIQGTEATTARGADSPITAPPSTGDAATDQLDRAVARKVNSICRGC